MLGCMGMKSGVKCSHSHALTVSLTADSSSWMQVASTQKSEQLWAEALNGQQRP